MLNQIMKWRYDYVIAFLKKEIKNKKMDDLLDNFYDDVKFSVKRNFNDYIVKVSQLNSPYFVPIKPHRGKILGERQKILFRDLKAITENIYKKYALRSKDFEREFFSYFKLVKDYGNYQFHLLVTKKDYSRNGR